MFIKSRVKASLFLTTYIYHYALHILLLASFILILYHHSNPLKISTLRVYVNDQMASLMEMFQRPGRFFINSKENIEEFLFTYQHNEKLRQENAQLKVWQNLAIRLESDNVSMKNLLNLKEVQNFSYISAKVIGDASSPYSKTLLIKVGQKDGAEPGQAVLYGNFLIGRIIEVGKSTSRVMLLTDYDSHIPVKVLPNMDRAILSGSEDRLILNYMRDDSTFEQGDFVLTSGADGILPEGLVVGKIAGDILHVISPVDLSKLDLVQIRIEEKPSIEKISADQSDDKTPIIQNQ